MLYLQNLRVRLQERRNRLYRAGYLSYDAELQYLLELLAGNPYSRSLLTVLDASDSVNFEQWSSDHSTRQRFEFPNSEEGRAKICYNVLKQCADDESDQNGIDWGTIFSTERQYDAILRDFTEAIVDPLINFLHDQIDDGGNVLYLIERFKLKTEWFRRQELHGLYLADTSVGEASLDRELRAGLFDGGVDYPFSQPSSPSGQADIVALLGSDDPIVLEVKVFDPSRSKGKRHLSQGFHQVLRYSNDYNQSVGYLVVFNCSDRQLVISSDEPSDTEFPPRITYAGKTFFTISIDIHTTLVSASKEKPTNRLVINTNELVLQDD